MGLKDAWRRLTTPVEDLERERLQDRFADFDDAEPISDVKARQRVTVCGEIKSTKVVPRAGSPSLEVRLADGTGEVTVVFTGRKRLGGVGPGRAMVVEGVARPEDARLILLNPDYTLLP